MFKKTIFLIKWSILIKSVRRIIAKHNGHKLWKLPSAKFKKDFENKNNKKNIIMPKISLFIEYFLKDLIIVSMINKQIKVKTIISYIFPIKINNGKKETFKFLSDE